MQYQSGDFTRGPWIAAIAAEEAAADLRATLGEHVDQRICFWFFIVA